MEIDRQIIWPLVKMDEVNPDWWMEVMRISALFEKEFDPRLPEDDDFTLRVLVTLAASRSPEEIAWFLETSFHCDRIIWINRQLYSPLAQDRATGTLELKSLIQEFTSDVLKLDP